MTPIPKISSVSNWAESNSVPADVAEIGFFAGNRKADSAGVSVCKTVVFGAEGKGVCECAGKHARQRNKPPDRQISFWRMARSSFNGIHTINVDYADKYKICRR
jgi:hypothetical protein